MKTRTRICGIHRSKDMDSDKKVKVLGNALIVTIQGDKYVRVADLLLFLYKCKTTYRITAYDSLIKNCEDLIAEKAT